MPARFDDFAIGTVASMARLFSSHHFFQDVWTPVEMIVERPITLSESRVRDTVRQAKEHPAPRPPIAQRPLPPPPPDDICYSPDTPGTPPTVIAGPPGPGGIPGPPTIISGTPPIPGSRIRAPKLRWPRHKSFRGWEIREMSESEEVIGPASVNSALARSSTLLLGCWNL